MLSTEEYLVYVESALDQQLAIAAGLGDERVNRLPDLDGANSPYAIVTHCLGVMEYWGGEVVAGRSIERDRAAELRAVGTLAELTPRVEAAKARLRADVATAEPDAPPRKPPSGPVEPGYGTQGGVLMHIYEELAQHLGQLELTRDLLLAD